MTLHACQDQARRVRRFWWERLVRVRLALRCRTCGRRLRVWA